MTSKGAKAPPVLKDGVVYSTWRHELEAWQLLTDLAVEKQAIQIYLYGLEGQFRDLISKIPIRTLNAQNGVKALLDKLDEFCVADKSRRAFNLYEKLYTFRRKSSQSISEALMMYDGILSDFNAEGMQLPGEVMAFHVLKAMNLSSEKEGLARATIDTYDYKTMVAKIQSLSCESIGGNNKSDTETDIKPPEGLETDVLYSSTKRNFNKYNNKGASGGQRRCYICNSPDHMANNCPNRKSKSGQGVKCFNCNRYGHYSKGCPENRGNKDNSVHITLFQSDPGVSNFLNEALGHAIIDTACKHTLAGTIWMEQYMNTLSDKEKQGVVQKSCDLSFRFGDGKETRALCTMDIPVNLGGTKCNLNVAVIENDLPLLLSIASMQRGNMKLDYGKNVIEVFGKNIPLKFTTSGHSMISVTEKSVDNVANIVLHVTGLDNLSQSGKMSKMKKLHIQFSHASQDALWRLLQSSGVHDASLKSALAKVCSNCEVCSRFKKKPLRPCVTEPLAQEFNSTVAMDLKTVVKDKVYILHFICLGTKFSAGCIVRSKSQDVILKKVLSVWVQVFGAPRRFLTDNGGEFSNQHFRELCQKFNIESTTTPGESPWSNGVVERHNAILMDTVNKTVEECRCDLETALSWALSVKNTLSSVHGYSPNTLVFGKNPNMPSVLSDSIPALEDCTTSELLLRNLNALDSARRSYISADTSERIRRALRMKTRVSNNVVVSIGDSVLYRREKYKGWLGPGKVIGYDNKLILVRHGGECYRVPQCQIVLYKADGSNSDSTVVDNVEDSSQNDASIVQSPHIDVSIDRSPPIDDSDDDSIEVETPVQGEVEAPVQEVEAQVHVEPEMQDQGIGERVEPIEEFSGRILPRVKSKVSFLSKEDNLWHTATIIGKGGKSTGSNKDYLNIQVVGEEVPKGVFWNRHVEVWKPVQEEETVVLLTTKRVG